MDIRFSAAFMQCVKDAALELEKAGLLESRSRLKEAFKDFYVAFKNPGPQEDVIMVVDGPELGLGPTHPPIYLISTLLSRHRSKSDPAE